MKIRSVFAILTMAALLAACAPKIASTDIATSVSTEGASATLAPTPSGNVFSVEISGFAFAANMVTIKVGDTVTWTNQDTAPHTVVADDSSFKSNSLSKGASFSHTYDSVGTYSYHCGIHSSMTGTVIVEP